MKTVSDVQKRILDFITSFIDGNGYSPSVREIAKGCRINSSTVAQYHLNRLEDKGYIRRNRDVSRSVVLLKKRLGYLSVPLLGTIAAGNPIPVPDDDKWVQVPDEVLEIPEDIISGRKNVYALRVKGTSMIDSFIDDGDIVLMQYVNVADDGSMVAAWIKDKQEVTLKKIYRERDRIRLQPANSQMKPIYCNEDDLEVQGKVVGVIRKL